MPMPRGYRRVLFAAVGWIVLLLGILITVALAWGVGWLQAREKYQTQQNAAAYERAAEQEAQRSCVGRKAPAVFECVYEKIESGQQQAHDQEDLRAQQRAASSALVSALISVATLLLSGFGLWYVKGTLDATRDAVEKASDGAKAANAAVEQARDSSARTEVIGKKQVRAYITISPPSVIIDFDSKLTTSLFYRNSGQSPARKIGVEYMAVVVSGGQPVFNTQTFCAFPRDVSPSEQDNVMIELKIPASHINSLTSFGSQIYLEGIIRYQDVFEEAQTEPFRYTLFKVILNQSLQMMRPPFET